MLVFLELISHMHQLQALAANAGQLGVEFAKSHETIPICSMMEGSDGAVCVELRCLRHFSASCWLLILIPSAGATWCQLGTAKLQQRVRNHL